MGRLSSAVLPIYGPDRQALRLYCTKGIVDGKQVCAPLMKVEEFNSQPYSFILKYCRSASGTRQEQADRVLAVMEEFNNAHDPETG